MAERHTLEGCSRPLGSSKSSDSDKPPIRHSKQTSLLAFYSSPGHNQKQSPPSHKTPDRFEKIHSKPQRLLARMEYKQKRFERRPRVLVAKQTLDIIPDVLSQLPCHPPTGYLHTPPHTRFLDPKYCPNLKGEVRVVEGDTFDTAIQFDQLFSRKDPQNINIRPVCVLNMANAETPGGGWLNGAMAQEEELCYRSSLSFTLKRRFYPLGQRDAIYSPNVVIARKSTKEGYEWLNLKRADTLPVVSAVSMAALERPELLQGQNGFVYKNPTDREMMKEKMRVILRVAAYNKHRRLVLGAFGCGAFHNPREEVAKCWAEVLKEKEFQGWWETIAFAIITPPGQSQQRPSLELFKEMLDGLSV